MNFFKQSVDKIVASLLRHVDSLEKHAEAKLHEAKAHVEQAEYFKTLQSAALQERDRASRVSAKLRELLN